MIDANRWRELQPLLDHALQLPDAERDAWLEATRSRSPSLAAELDTLLAHERAADRSGFLTGAPVPSLVGAEVG
ncbi:MAG TPA: hypothetical protein VFZ21_06890, partial [Gemmatimonadaceae bacterium]|nr:hypothetical protein [Gemmatimonadaceae bacterium]